MRTIIIDHGLRDEFDIQEFISATVADDDGDIIFVSDKYAPEVEEYLCGIVTAIDDIEEAEETFGVDLVFTSGTDVWGFALGNMDFDVAIVKEGSGDMYNKDERYIEYKDGWLNQYKSLTSYYY